MAVRLRRAAWIGCLLALTHGAYAYAPRSGPRIAADTLTALPAANLPKPLRVQPRLRYGLATPPLAWSHFVARRGGTWQAAWDVATGVPSRIWGTGIPAPGTVANAEIAERFARQILADHLGLLAPGAKLEDFVLASNHFDGSTRSIGFFQYAGGRRVVGGQLSFRFKNDRLFVIGSEALPYVTFATPRSTLPYATMRTRATETLRRQLALPSAPVSELGEEVVLPLVGDHAVLGYRLARTATIDGGADGRYLAYVEVATGEVLAVQQLNTYATGTVLYNTVDRFPAAGRARIPRPATRTHVTVGGVMKTTSTTGTVTWSPNATTTVQTTVTGDLVTVVNKASDDAFAANATHELAPGGSLVWDASTSEFDDAQVNTFIATGLAKEYVRKHIDPAMPTLDEQMIANVNIAKNCNAYFDGKTINFYQANERCQNTGLLHDVIYHEYGHRLHTAEIIPGVGAFDGAMSEGAADFLAASITGDSGMGRGFFYGDQPLRELDPPDKEWMWPADIGEIHHTGQIYGGVFWDLRKQLIEDLGEAAGIALVNRLYLATMRRAVNIPTSLIEALAEDDDDGNLENGTPHECAIRAAFGRHGLRTASGTVIAPGLLQEKALAVGVHVEVSGLSEACTGDEVASVRLEWLSYGGGPKGSMQATPAGTNKFFAQMPLALQDVTYYKVHVRFVDGSSMILADNMADPWYQIYTGEVVRLYCTDFETTDPFAEGWTAGTDDHDTHDWQWGTPIGGPTDPRAAYSGSKIVGLKLDGDYSPMQRTWLKSPPIYVGQYSDVRLQFRRWLAVEDSYYDQARITANGKQAWVNFSGDAGESSSIHHVDKEWRFQDVALSPHFYGKTVTVGWEIDSDEGLHLGGWHLDDVCIVANPYAICGDGVKTATEQCDLGADNRDAPDVCRTDCRLPTCGDYIVDSNEECDDGPEGTETCSTTCTIVTPTDGGCCSAGGGQPASLLLAGGVGLLLLRRRRSSQAGMRQDVRRR